jgi:AcrR family transcriptional regulator
MILCSTIIVKGKEPDRHEARRSAIVAAARKAFLRDGYGQTSMSSIAADVGGSKTTLWNYFPSKEDLFAAVVDDQVERYGEALRLELPEDADLPETLTALGVSILTTILRPVSPCTAWSLVRQDAFELGGCFGTAARAAVR